MGWGKESRLIVINFLFDNILTKQENKTFNNFKFIKQFKSKNEFIKISKCSQISVKYWGSHEEQDNKHFDKPKVIITKRGCEK